MLLSEMKVYVGGLSKPSKMPGWAYGLPAAECKIGSQLAKEPGSVCEGCYALKGNYRFSNVRKSQYAKLAAIRKPRWVKYMTALISHYSAECFRWHDSGDLQDIEHLDRIVEIARALPDTKFWIPTREVHLIRTWLSWNGSFPVNLCVRISAAMRDTPAPRHALAVMQPTSTVHSADRVAVGRGEIECLAYTRGGECGPCRACWSSKVSNVSYGAH